MRIIIVGGGKVGEALCRDFDADGNDVVLIEEKEEVLSEMLGAADITGILGNGASYDTLMSAETAKCDAFIAATQQDEINVISCVIAKKIGAAYTIARVRNPEYAAQGDFMRESLGINVMFNPEREAAHAMLDLVRFPFAMSVERFAHGRVTIVSLRLDKGSKLAGKTLQQLRTEFSGRWLAVLAERNDDVLIPDGSFVLQEDDVIHLTGDLQVLSSFCRECGVAPFKRMRSIMVIGAGRLTYYLLQYLEKMSLRIKVLEQDSNIAKRLSEKFPHVDVVCADGSDQSILDEEGVEYHDCVIALTGIDEENLLIAMYAKQCGVSKVISKVNRTMLLRILDPHSYGAIITPKRIVADMILRDVRALKQVGASRTENLYRLADGRVEAMQFMVHPESRIIGIPLKDYVPDPDVLIVAILRNHQVIYPDGLDTIEAGDHVILVAKDARGKVIDDYLKRR